MNWHYDKKLTVGNEYNMVITIVDTSDMVYIYKSKNNDFKFIKLAVLSSEIHNKDTIVHKVTNQTYGKRMVVIFTYSTQLGENKYNLQNKLLNSIYYSKQLLYRKKCLIIGGENGIGGEIVHILKATNCNIFILGRNTIHSNKNIFCDLSDLKSVFKALDYIIKMGLVFD